MPSFKGYGAKGASKADLGPIKSSKSKALKKKADTRSPRGRSYGAFKREEAEENK